MLSIIIPSYKDPLLHKTVDSLLENARGEIEIIIVLDGYWTTPKDDPRVITIHLGKNSGMRAAINAGVAVAKGEYLMKCDAHCLFSKKFDRRLIQFSAPNQVQVPKLYDLNVENWERGKERPEFQYIEKGTLKGKWWPEYKSKGDLVDLMTMQGSCWFMPTAYFHSLGGLDEENYGGMGREAQEISLKAWTTGGSVKLNRRAWYAHWSKPKEWSLGKPGKEKSIAYAQSVWTEDKLAPLIKKFNPPGYV